MKFKFDIRWVTLRKKIESWRLINSRLGFSRKKLYPCALLLRISFFWIWFPLISSQFYDDPPGIFHFFASTSLEILVCPSNFDIPPGIPTMFTLPPGNFHWYPQQGVSNFFWKSPFYRLKNDGRNTFRGKKTDIYHDKRVTKRNTVKTRYYLAVDSMFPKRYVGQIDVKATLCAFKNSDNTRRYFDVNPISF